MIPSPSAVALTDSPPLWRTQTRVALGDVDGARLIYYAVPFRWSEGLMSTWLAERVRPLGELFTEGIAIPVVSTSADFRSPLRQDEQIELILRAGPVGRTSFTIVTDALKGDGSVAVRVKTVHVYVADLAGDVTPSPLPAWLRQPLTASMAPDQRTNA